MIVDVEQAYNAYFELRGAQEMVIPMEARKVYLEGQFQGDEDARYRLDAAMWYGIIKKEPNAYYTPLIKNMFILFYYGGLMYRETQNSWLLWANAQIPVAAAPSHGGRVLVQLPRDGTASKNDFWNWLWGGLNVEKRTRWASTHEVSHLSINEVLPRNRMKFIKEEKLGFGGKLWSNTGQYGVNIPVGGLGNINPFSGAKITADGRFGHLFLYYQEPTASKNGAMLIGSEASGPSDHDILKVGTEDQYGGSHGFGGSTTFEATGGKRWKDQSWHGRGPTGSYDFLFIDLAATGWNFLSLKVFDKAILGMHGELPQAAILPTLMSLTEWKKRRYVHGRANQILKKLDTAVAEYHKANANFYKKVVLLNIIAYCDEYIVSKVGKKEGSHARVRAAQALKSEAGAVLATLP